MVLIIPPPSKYSAAPGGVDRFKLPWWQVPGCCFCRASRTSAVALASSSGAQTGTVSPGASDEGMSFNLPILSSSTTRTGSPSLMFSSLPSFVMSMTSAVVPSDFFFFDFEADFEELEVFEPQAPHRGIPMMNASQLDMG